MHPVRAGGEGGAVGSHEKACLQYVQITQNLLFPWGQPEDVWKHGEQSFFFQSLSKNISLKQFSRVFNLGACPNWLLIM